MPAGPGKFESEPCSTFILWQLSMDSGHDDETGTTDEGGWFALFRGQVTPDTVLGGGEYTSTIAAQALDYGYTAEELLSALRALQGSVGAILGCDSQGFVTANVYTDRSALDNTWHLLQDSWVDEEGQL